MSVLKQIQSMQVDHEAIFRVLLALTHRSQSIADMRLLIIRAQKLSSDIFGSGLKAGRIRFIKYSVPRKLR